MDLQLKSLQAGLYATLKNTLRQLQKTNLRSERLSFFSPGPSLTGSFIDARVSGGFAFARAARSERYENLLNRYSNSNLGREFLKRLHLFREITTSLKT